MLRRQLRRLKDVEQKQNGYDSGITKEMQTLARVIKELAGEIRKLEDRETEEYGALSFEERVRLFIEQFFANLPAEHQSDMMRLMEKVYQSQRNPIPELPSHE